MKEIILLNEKQLKEFCKEIKLKTRCSKIFIKINENRAEYYNFDDDCFYKLDINIAKKYLDNKTKE